MSKDISNSIQNDTLENQDDLNDPEILETGGFKHGGKIGKFMNDKNYVSGNGCDSFQDKLLRTPLENESKYDKHYVNFFIDK